MIGVFFKNPIVTTLIRFSKIASGNGLAHTQVV